MKPIVKVSDVSKQYRLGTVGTGTFAHDVNRWWHTVRGKEDPYQKLGEVNDRTSKGSSQYVWALKDINFDVMPGEVLGIIGKNGAGKSTLLKLLSRVTGPTTGSIEARGRIASLLEVGTGFHPELTGRENVFLNGAILGMTKKEIRSKLDEIVEFSGCERYLDTPVKRYSSGMKVRLAFAVAAHLEPEILIVDEVLAVGDAEFQAKAIGKMQDVSKGEGRTVLFVSHNMASIQALCSRCILLNNGAIAADGGVQEIIAEYLSLNSNAEGITYENQNKNSKNIVWIESAEVLQNEKLVNQVILGKDLTFRFRYEAKEKGLKCALNIGVYNQTGEKILHLGSAYGELESFSTKDSGEIICEIPKLPLVAGKYSINFSLHLNGQPHHRVSNALGISVEEGDYFGNGKIPKPKESKVLVEQNWYVN